MGEEAEAVAVTEKTGLVAELVAVTAKTGLVAEGAAGKDLVAAGRRRWREEAGMGSMAERRMLAALLSLVSDCRARFASVA